MTRTSSGRSASSSEKRHAVVRVARLELDAVSRTAASPSVSPLRLAVRADCRRRGRAGRRRAAGAGRARRPAVPAPAPARRARRGAARRRLAGGGAGAAPRPRRRCAARIAAARSVAARRERGGRQRARTFASSSSVRAISRRCRSSWLRGLAARLRAARRRASPRVAIAPWRRDAGIAGARRSPSPTRRAWPTTSDARRASACPRRRRTRPPSRPTVTSVVCRSGSSSIVPSVIGVASLAHLML